MFTPQERKLLPLLFKDISSKEVSNEMGLDARTVSSYQRSILEKLSEFREAPILTRLGLVVAYFTDPSVRAKLKGIVDLEV